MGYLFLGTGGALVAAICVLATSGSLLVAFLTYMVGGVLLTLTAAALSLTCAPLRASISLKTGSRRR